MFMPKYMHSLHKLKEDGELDAPVVKLDAAGRKKGRGDFPKKWEGRGKHKMYRGVKGKVSDDKPPTYEERELVKKLAGYDLDDDQIALCVRFGITTTELRKWFKNELEIRGEEGTWARRIMRKKDRALVEKLSGYGLTHEQIAACVCGGIHRQTLEKYFPLQLKKGKADAIVKNTIRLEQAAEEGSVPAMIHLDNTRGVGAELRKKETQSLAAVVFDRVERVVIDRPLLEDGSVIDGEIVDKDPEVGGSAAESGEV